MLVSRALLLVAIKLVNGKMTEFKLKLIFSVHQLC